LCCGSSASESLIENITIPSVQSDDTFDRRYGDSCFDYTSRAFEDDVNSLGMLAPAMQQKFNEVLIGICFRKADYAGYHHRMPLTAHIMRKSIQRLFTLRTVSEQISDWFRTEIEQISTSFPPASEQCSNSQ
jgi:hypothetical protein